MLSAGWGGGAKESVGAEGWMKAGGTIYQCFSLVNSKHKTVLLLEPKSSDNNRQTVEPFLTSVFYTQSPADWGLNIPPKALNTASCLPLYFGSCCKHTQRHMPGVCTYPSRDADKQLNRWGANKMKCKNNLTWHTTYKLTLLLLPLSSISAIRASCVLSSCGAMKRCF